MEPMVIEPRRERGEPELDGPGLLLINPGEADLATRLAKAQGFDRHFLFNSRLHTAQASAPPCFWAGPMVGAPMAALTLEKLIALGGREFFVYGWCGSLHQSLEVGDLLLPTRAVSSEGTSAHYPVAQPALAANRLHHRLADHFAAHGLAPRAGAVWTTDAPYRESRAQVTRLADQGIVAVEMELAALFTVAAFRGVTLAAALMVSDELWRQQWTPGFRRKDFRTRNRALVEGLLAFIQQPAGSCRDR